MRQTERNHVFNNCQVRIKKATIDYLQTHGYYITNIEDMKNLNDDSILGSILPSVNEYTKHVKVVSDGIRVTDSRLEKMLKCIYAIEDTTTREKNNEHNIQLLMKEYNRINNDSSAGFLLFIAIILSFAAITLPFLGIVTPHILLISICMYIASYLRYKKIEEMENEIKEEIKHKAVMIVSKL